MPDEPIPAPSEDRPVQARLHELAQFLRQAKNLTPVARQTLADLVAELSQDLKPDTLSPAEKAHLADTVAQLTRTLQEVPARGRSPSTHGRLEQALVRAETDNPVAAGFLQRLLDAIANLGI